MVMLNAYWNCRGTPSWKDKAAAFTQLSRGTTALKEAKNLRISKPSTKISFALRGSDTAFERPYLGKADGAVLQKAFVCIICTMSCR